MLHYTYKFEGVRTIPWHFSPAIFLQVKGTKTKLIYSLPEHHLTISQEQRNKLKWPSQSNSFRLLLVGTSVTVLLCGILFHLQPAVLEFTGFQSVFSGPPCGISGCLYALFSPSNKRFGRRKSKLFLDTSLACDTEPKVGTRVEMLKYVFRGMIRGAVPMPSITRSIR